MTNRKIEIACVLVVLAIISVALVITELQQPVKAQMKTTTTMINFTQSFAKTYGRDVSVVYQSSATVVLEGEAITLQSITPTPTENAAFENNQKLWKAVDAVKQHGFTIDSVVTSGLSTANNPLVYHIVLSHK